MPSVSFTYVLCGIQSQRSAACQEQSLAYVDPVMGCSAGDIPGIGLAAEALPLIVMLWYDTPVNSHALVYTKARVRISTVRSCASVAHEAPWWSCCVLFHAGSRRTAAGSRKQPHTRRACSSSCVTADTEGGQYGGKRQYKARDYAVGEQLLAPADARRPAPGELAALLQVSSAPSTTGKNGEAYPSEIHLRHLLALASSAVCSPWA